MSDYAPTEEDFIRVYGVDGIGVENQANVNRARRGIAKLKADALREWAQFQEAALEASHHALDQDELNTTLAWIDDAKAYALRVEGEA